MKFKKRWLFILFLFISVTTLSLPELLHKNNGVSVSTGSVRNGKLQNGWLIPYHGANFHFFSPVSYFLLNNGYVHSSVHRVIMDAYKICELTCPDKEFILMECSQKHGGRMIFHWTHQNGMSADFMTPVKRNNNGNVWINHMGLSHYLLKFNEDGKWNLGRKTEIDFETMARHIIALDDAAAKNGMRIRKILFHTDLQDELFNSPSGQILLERDINFISRLSNFVNRLHDDHYHVDFEMNPTGERD